MSHCLEYLKNTSSTILEIKDKINSSEWGKGISVHIKINKFGNIILSLRVIFNRINFIIFHEVRSTLQKY
jgi:hypothetical protein